MKRLFLSLLTSLLFAAHSAQADEHQSDDFCLLASDALLSAVEGNWMLRQHAGAASAAGLVIPLPPNPAQPVNILFDIERGVAVMSGAEQEMLLIPTLPGALQNALQFMNESEAEGLLEIGSGCNFYDLPLVLGTNRYSLATTDSIQVEPGSVLSFVFLGEHSYVCVSEATLREAGASSSVGYVNYESRSAVYIEGERYDQGRCEQIVSAMPRAGSGQLVMSLAVKFQTPNSATGMLYFEGERDGYFFAAKAPVTLSR